MKHRIALYGANGHQIQQELPDNPRAELAAYAKMKLGRDFPAAKQYGSLDEILDDPDIELVSLCSPVRAEQQEDAIKALKKGKHVLAEKPAAMTEAGLDRILNTARENSRLFHAMSATAFEQPYLAIRNILRETVIGEIMQVHIRKSYPWHEERPIDSLTDGGLLLWTGIHAARIAEHVCGMKLRGGGYKIFRGLPPGNGREKTELAAAVLAEFENGAPVTMDINYLNRRESGIWGYDELRIFGRDGIIESLAGGEVCRILRKGEPFRELERREPSLSWFECFLDELDGKPFPISLEEEFSPDRFLLKLQLRQP